MSETLLLILLAAFLLLVIGGIAAARSSRAKKRKAELAEEAIRAEDVVDLADALKKVFRSVQEPKPELDEAAPAAPLLSAQRVLFIPGEGMAASKAQLQAKQLARLLQKRGAFVQFILHPEAGHENGRLRALLAEADISDDLCLQVEPDGMRPDVMQCDVCIAIGANDIINPAANTAEEGSPLFGKPVLPVEAAKHLILCNLDASPGLSGVENPLYARTIGITHLMGDAKDSLQALLDGLEAA